MNTLKIYTRLYIVILLIYGSVVLPIGQAVPADSSGLSNIDTMTRDEGAVKKEMPIDSYSVGGWLERGICQDTVLERLGEPEEKGDNELWEATYSYYQEWRYPTRGLTLLMNSDSADGKKTVQSINVVAPCTLKTPEGIGVGAELDVVKSRYTGRINAEYTEEDRVMVGSLYDGMILFVFQGSKVQEIVISAHEN